MAQRLLRLRVRKLGAPFFCQTSECRFPIHGDLRVVSEFSKRGKLVHTVLFVNQINF